MCKRCGGSEIFDFRILNSRFEINEKFKITCKLIQTIYKNDLEIQNCFCAFSEAQDKQGRGIVLRTIFLRRTRRPLMDTTIREILSTSNSTKSWPETNRLHHFAYLIQKLSSNLSFHKPQTFEDCLLPSF